MDGRMNTKKAFWRGMLATATRRQGGRTEMQGIVVDENKAQQQLAWVLHLEALDDFGGAS